MVENVEELMTRIIASQAVASNGEPMGAPLS